MEENNKVLVEQLLELEEFYMAHEVLLKQYDDKLKPKELQKYWTKGQIGGAKWDIWVVQIIYEQLIIGVPPITITSSTYTVYETLFGFPPA